MSRRPFFFAPFLVLLSVALTGCQQAAWKAGASADDFKRDELACKEQAGDDAAISQCLRNKGWSLANFDAQADSEYSSTTNESTPTPESAPPPLSESVRKSPTPSAQTDATEEPKAIASKSGKAAAPADPMQRQSVQTWWKAGAQAADFQIDADRCLSQLGEQHKPDYAKRLYTRATVTCMRERGWYAGRDPVYTPLR